MNLFKTYVLIFCSFILFSSNVEAKASPSEEEALFIRRIVMLWEEKSFDLLEQQIALFLKEYPESSFLDSSYMILGNLYFTKEEYQRALKAYHAIATPLLKKKVLPNLLQSYYKIGGISSIKENFSLSKDTMPSLDNLKTNEQQLLGFYFAESQFKEGLNKEQDRISQIEKNKNFALAENYYLALLESNYKDLAFSSLIKFYQTTQKIKELMTLYSKGMELYPDKKEEFLFLIASFEAKTSPNKAFKLFKQVESLGGDYALEAVFRRAVLLYEKKDYKEFISLAEKVQEKLPIKQKDKLCYLLGKSYFFQNDYDQTIKYLSYCTESKNLKKEQIKNCYLTIIASVHKQNKLEVINFWVGRFSKEFLGDIDYAKTLYLQALTFESHKEFDDALRLFDRLESEYEFFEEKEQIGFIKNRIFYKQGKLDKSRKGFLEGLNKEYGKKNLNASLMFIAKIFQQKVEQFNGSEEERDQLLFDSKVLLDHTRELGMKKVGFFFLDIAQKLVQSGKERASFTLELLLPLTKKMTDQKILYQSYYLAGLCYQKVNQSDLAMIQFNKALTFTTSQDEAKKLHLFLFNHYVKLKKMDIAANHYYEVIMNEQNIKAINHKNILWVSNYFFKKIEGSELAYRIQEVTEKEKLKLLKKLSKLLEFSWGFMVSEADFLVTKESSYLKEEAFKYAMLLKWKGKVKGSIRYLKFLDKLQRKEKGTWKRVNQVRFSLGEAYLDRKKGKKALRIFSALADREDSKDLYLYNSSRFYSAILSYKYLDSSEKYKDNPTVQAILKVLYLLQTRKKLEHEPLHLEAALEYASIVASLEKEGKEKKVWREKLQEAKRNFLEEGDIASRDYMQSLASDIEKRKIYDAYMILFDAHLALTDAQISEDQGEKLEALNHAEASVSLFKTLLKEEFAVSKYLVDQAKLGLKQSQETVMR